MGGGVDKAAAFVGADHGIDDRIDVTYRTKDRRYSASPVDRMGPPWAKPSPSLFRGISAYTMPSFSPSNPVRCIARLMYSACLLLCRYIA